MNIAILSLLLVVGILLIFLIYIQSGEVKGLASSVVGTKDVELFENKKTRGSQKWLNISTWLLVILYFSFSLILFAI